MPSGVDWVRWSPDEAHRFGAGRYQLLRQRVSPLATTGFDMPTMTLTRMALQLRAIEGGRDLGTAEWPHIRIWLSFSGRKGYRSA
jgi:hypothetical protein